MGPAFSPDGQWLAFGSNVSGTWQIHVRRFPDDGRQVQVSSLGGRVPHWHPDGRTLLYSTDERLLMAVDYKLEDGAFVPGQPRPWFNGRLADTGVIANFDVMSDGRALALIPDDSSVTQRLAVLTHFPALR